MSYTWKSTMLSKLLGIPLFSFSLCVLLRLQNLSTHADC